MSSAKHRHKQSSSERGAQPAPGDVAKKSVKESIGTGTAGSRSLGLGKAFNFLFYAGLWSLATFSGWCVYNLLEEVAEMSRRHGDMSRQSGELAQNMEGMLKQVHSLQITVGNIEATLKDTKQRQEWTETALQYADTEVKRIDDVINKMQNEILKDLSDGIQDVKNARERDVPFFEKTMEEKLTDLTASINDNIAIFTKVQRTSQNEIGNIKERIVLLEEAHSLKDDFAIMKSAVSELQTSMTSNTNGIDLLKNTVQSMENYFYKGEKEVALLKQQYDAINEAANTAHLAIQALEDKVLKAEESNVQLPNEIERLNTAFQQLKYTFGEQESILLSEKQALAESNTNMNKRFESRLRVTEENIELLNSVAAEHSTKIDSFLSGQEEVYRRLGHLDQIQSAMQTSNKDSHSLGEIVSNIADSHEALSRDIGDLKQQIRAKADELKKVEDEVSSLLGHHKEQILELQTNQVHMSDGLEQMQNHIESQNNLELVSIQEAVHDLGSSVQEVDSELKMLSTTVDSLVVHSVQMKEHENNVLVMQDSIDKLRNSQDKILEKIEIIQESI
ncbi:cytoskeleton-associated protein 4 [Ambystoma mexicanum]|uniref:cytoskeleton-associated protein 4 n=1 Tax=Ambystoma mexicanum TaxID=8296 RepID=UPI0037E89416